MNDPEKVSRREFLIYTCGVTGALLASNASATIGTADLPPASPWTNSPMRSRTACCSGTGAAFGRRQI